MTVASPATTIASLPTAPARNGYTFAGWWTAENGGGTEFTATTAVTANITVYAKWSLKPVYTASFVDYDGTTVLLAETVAENETATAPDPEPTKTGYIFDGWYADADCTTPWDFATKISKTTTIYARWKARLTFHSGTGTGSMGDLYVAKSASQTLPANTFTHDGYEFVGWATEENAKSIAYADKATVTETTGAFSLWACWTPVGAISADKLTYTITDGNITISKYTGTEKNAVIPGWIDGHPVTSIASFAFQTNSSVTSIIIPDTFTSIGREAFSSCMNLASVTIPSSVTTIGMLAFNSCSKLTSITIPSSVSSIEAGAFQSCSGLTSITIPSSVTSMGDSAFYNCYGLTSVEIPSSITSISQGAFGACASLKSVIIPSSVTSIGISAFYQCTKLSSVTIPESVNSIGDFALAGCSNLTAVTIPASVASIGNEAFTNLNLAVVTVRATTPPTIGSNVFNKAVPLKIYVPAGSVDAYKTSWSGYKDYIFQQ
jgi:uncharacterized repeat protein (TIGR02543 family)